MNYKDSYNLHLRQFLNDPTNRWLSRHQMSVNGKLEDIRIEDFMISASRMNIGKRRAEKIIEEVRHAVLRWSSFSGQSGIREEIASQIQKQLFRDETNIM